MITYIVEKYSLAPFKSLKQRKNRVLNIQKTLLTSQVEL